MKSFKIEFYREWQEEKVFSRVFDWVDQKEVSQIIWKQWCQIKSIYEVKRELKWVEKVQEYFKKNFSSWNTYDPDVEIAFLEAFCVGLSDTWWSEAKAIESSKSSFWRSSKKIRWQIDEMVKTSSSSWINNLYDIFARYETFFSSDFLTLIKNIFAKEIRVNLAEVISNENEEKPWFLQIKKSILLLTNEMKSQIIPPIMWLFWMLWASLTIILVWIPFLNDKAKPLGLDIYEWDFTLIWNSVISLSYFLTNYWIYLLVPVIWWFFWFIFFYNRSLDFKIAVQKFLLKAWFIWDIFSVFYTKKACGLMTMFRNSWMSTSDMFSVTAWIIDFLPIKHELEYFWKKEWEWVSLDSIVNSIPNSEKYFTEMFYSKILSDWWKWRYDRAFSSIIKNADNIWRIDLKKYPQKIWFVIRTVWFAIVWYIILWIMMIFALMVSNAM